MSAQPSFGEGAAPGGYTQARVQRIERILDSYGVLTRRRLYILAGAKRWESDESFRHVCDVAVRQGRAKPLGSLLLESTRMRSAG
jgi:hypothetical protein